MANWIKRAQTVFRETPDRDTAVTDDRNLTAEPNAGNSTPKRTPIEAVPVAHREGMNWPPGPLDAEQRFGYPHARLFPFIGRKVRTPKGPGTLVQVFADRVTVVLDSEVSRCSFFRPLDIEPVSWEVSE
jgi:hypothetical protein